MLHSCEAIDEMRQRNSPGRKEMIYEEFKDRAANRSGTVLSLFDRISMSF